MTETGRRRSLVIPAVLGTAALALAAILILYAVTLWVVRSESDAALRRSVDTEIAALADIHATGGRAELLARVGDRLALRAGGGADRSHYLVADASGKRIAGDIARWPLLSAENSQAGFTILADGTPVYGRATMLAPDLRLVAAREYGGRTRLIGRIGLAFLLAGIGIFAAALALAWAGAARLRRRVERVNAAFRAIEAGDFERALPPAGRADEIGALTDHAGRLIHRLGDVIRAQRDVTDQVAHEIRTPLVHLDRQLLRLIEKGVGPALVAALGAVRQEARGIADLLDSLLDIASSEARRGDRAGFERVDLSEIAANIADLYAESAAELGIDFHTDIAPDVTLAGDRMQLSRALSNLLDNALNYAGKGAAVTLIVEPGPRIIVRDTGPGIPEGMRERIFERFARGPESGKGHGLGLALVRAIVRRHGLEVTCAETHPGARFVIAPEEGG
ncbi:MAG TPA: HAMP domain-containing sensor histidine kinase [Allosphingosinicella sp.]|nr:HAMP domain-containing sensor histidine kinase [Allosphingosinicella sp.]